MLSAFPLLLPIPWPAPCRSSSVNSTSSAAPTTRTSCSTSARERFNAYLKAYDIPYDVEDLFCVPSCFPFPSLPQSCLHFHFALSFSSPRTCSFLLDTILTDRMPCVDTRPAPGHA
ncbi:hypothetical protein K438DRAFT_2023441 [Mycena galopus ATCC 62051]|nr:hypothetical protein K438DRAFT_2023441 [Mycena galopus ATCC 62051]